MSMSGETMETSGDTMETSVDAISANIGDRIPLEDDVIGCVEDVTSNKSSAKKAVYL